MARNPFGPVGPAARRGDVVRSSGPEAEFGHFVKICKDHTAFLCISTRVQDNPRIHQKK